MNTPMDKTKLNIGVYCLAPYARSQKHIKELADCGVDFVVCVDNDRKALDLFARHGIGAVVKGIVPSWWGGNAENTGKMHLLNPRERYAAGAEAFCDHPAVWGIDMGDEPGAADFAYWGEMAALVEEKCPRQFAYMNLFPSYGSLASKTAQEAAAQLAAGSYEEYIDAYCKYVKSDYICFDFYVYSSEKARFFDDLATVSRACRRTGRDMWCVLQVNSICPESGLTEDQLRFQAFCAMAFGARNIIWACYTKGWWHHNVLDEQGERTPQYTRLQRVNGEIKALSGRYMSCRHRATRLLTPEKVGMAAGVFGQVSTDKDVLVGEMTDERGADALFVCPADDGVGEWTVRLSRPAQELQAWSGQGEVGLSPLPDGSTLLGMHGCRGVLVTER